MHIRTKISLALVLSLVLLPGVRFAAAAAPVQDENGSVLLPIRFPADVTYASWPGGHRNVYTVTNDNGHTGYTLALKPGTAGGAYALDVTGGATGNEDLDITFYTSFDPAVSPGASQTRGAGGESGPIPGGSNFAIITMFDGAEAEFRFRAYAPAKPAASSSIAAPLPKAPGIYPNFGQGGSGLTQKLRSRSHVVIAVVDTGINPYHLAYRSPEYGIHPSEYIEGFPKGAPALGLTLDKDYVKNRKADDGPVWSKVKEEKLYWIPGTNIVGAYSAYDMAGTPPEKMKSRPIIDDQGHGTGTTSVAGGISVSPTRKAPFGSNPQALIVMVEGLGDEAVKWASEQPWIDFISASYGDSRAIPFNDVVPDLPEVPEEGKLDSREYRYTAPFVLRDGRTACFSAGNGLSRTGIATDRYSSIRPTSGPSWVVTVGAVSPRNDQDYGWHSVPVDVSSYGLHWAAAAPFSVDGEQDFGGTSNATPVTCGAFSAALLEARRSLGDAVEGIHVAADGTRLPAIGPKGVAKGLIADGLLLREELQDAVLKTAQPGGFDTVRYTYDPIVIPDTTLYYTQEGYGIANVASAGRAADVILGRAEMPARSEVDAWIATIDLIRDAIWAPPTYQRAAPPAAKPEPKPAPRPAPKQKPAPKVLGTKRTLPATGLDDSNAALGVLLLLAAAGLVRRFSLAR